MLHHLFELTPDVMMASFDLSVIDPTYADMVEAGLANPPFPQFTLRYTFPKHDVIDESDDPNGHLDFIVQCNYINGIPIHENAGWKFGDENNFSPLDQLGAWYSHEFIPEDQRLRDDPVNSMGMHWAYRMLIVLLGTRAARKATFSNKKGKLGVGKKSDRKFDYITRIYVGHVVPSKRNNSVSTGITVRPHLRRGHLRRQHFKNEIKRIWIEPTFIHKDQGYEDRRIKYIVKSPPIPAHRLGISI